MFPVTEHCVKTARHTNFYLACGDASAPVIIFIHGWPELSWSWRHQLGCFAALGFRCIAPDMRGYGCSSVYPRHEDYAQQEIARDMVELIDAIGKDKAVWVGHDWGSPPVWIMASHHPDRCSGIASLCVPYFAQGFSLETVIPLVDRSIYPEAEYPYGQWEYQAFYQKHFDRACGVFDANVRNTVKGIFRRGDPSQQGKPARTAYGWREIERGNVREWPDLPLDTAVLTEADLHKYTAALQRNGFAGPLAWYMNHARNAAFARQAVNHGRLDMPVLFLHAAYDYTCETLTSRLAEPMRRDCTDLTENVVHSGHWMAQEKPVEVNAALAKWLAAKLPSAWR